jgi:hypothetical protein
MTVPVRLNKKLNLEDIAEIYNEKAGEWLLLEILETDTKNNPVKLKLLKHSPYKDELHEYLLEQDQWDWNKKYLIVLADPSKPCTIG